MRDRGGRGPARIEYGQGQDHPQKPSDLLDHQLVLGRQLRHGLVKQCRHLVIDRVMLAAGWCTAAWAPGRSPPWPPGVRRLGLNHTRRSRVVGGLLISVADQNLEFAASRFRAVSPSGPKFEQSRHMRNSGRPTACVRWTACYPTTCLSHGPLVPLGRLLILNQS